jgi:nicotinamide mononucleotide transporter
MQEIWNEFIAELSTTGWLQWVAVVFAVAEVLLAKSNNILLYPSGIIATSLFIFLFAEAALYAESALNGYYLIMSIYGWWYWTKKKLQPPVPVTYSNGKDRKIVFAIVGIGTAGIWAVLTYLTDSTVPLWDAWVSATAWAGMWLLAKRKIENWILLNISNAFAVPLLFHKHLPLSALLTVFLFIIAVLGYFEWKRIIKEQQSELAMGNGQ